MYSLDTFLPIVDFGQQQRWQPNTNGGLGWFALVAYWFEVASGWFISTLFVIGFTRLVRTDQFVIGR